MNNTYPVTDYPITRSEYAHSVYQLLAAHQVSDALRYDGDITINAASIKVRCGINETEITFPDPYANRTATITAAPSQASTTVVSIVEGLLTAFAPYLAQFDPYCCGLPMYEVNPENHTAPTRIFRCDDCRTLAIIHAYSQADRHDNTDLPTPRPQLWVK